MLISIDEVKPTLQSEGYNPPHSVKTTSMNPTSPDRSAEVPRHSNGERSGSPPRVGHRATFPATISISFSLQLKW